jgi:phage terminase large subunit-like protein
MRLDPWQAYALDRALEHDADFNLLARQVLLSVARQNGKSVIVRAFVGWLMDEGYKWDTFRKWDFILLAAHDAKQARIPYDFIRRDVMSYADINTWGHSARRQGVARARATQYTGIELNGVRVDVATSQPGSARGISPGLICFDEVLTQTSFETYEVLSPAQVAIPNSQMLMTSTAGFADSVVLRAMHDKLYRQSTNAEQHDPSFVVACRRR